MVDGYTVALFFVFIIIFLLSMTLLTREESLDEKIDRAINISDSINGEYCVNYSIDNQNKIIDEQYCIPVKNTKTIKSIHEQVIKRQTELDKINNDEILSKLLIKTYTVENKTASKTVNKSSWRGHI